MTQAAVLREMEDGVAVIRLNRPDRLNAFDAPMLDLLTATLLQAEAEGARCVLITGNGRAFSSGADLSTLSIDEPRLGRLLAEHYNPVIEVLAGLSIPVVTAVHGAAAGAGCALALAADIVVAARSAYLLLAFANVGLVPDMGATWLIAQAAGRARALEMALLGERMGADAARAAGLINRVVDDDRVFAEAMVLARALAAKPTLALGMIRAQVNLALTSSQGQSLTIEAENQQRAGDSADFREGARAFLAKRPPVFVGR